jgi:hypothetical protein
MRDPFLKSSSPLEQFRQPCEIDCHLSRLIDRQEAGVSCCIRVIPAVENAQLSANSVIDGESVRDLDDSPRCWKAAGHGRRSGGPGIFRNRDRARCACAWSSTSASKM